MATNRRTRRHARKAKITPEMVELIRRGEEIIAAGDNENWEDEGGHRREFLDICKKLNWSLLHRAPHEISVFDRALAGGLPPPEYINGTTRLLITAGGPPSGSAGR